MMKGHRKKVAAQLMNKLRESLALSAYSAAAQQQRSGYRVVQGDPDDLDDWTIGSEPKHYSSGSSLALFPSKYMDPRLLDGNVLSKNSLWADPSSPTSMEHQEKVLEWRKMQKDVQGELPCVEQATPAGLNIGTGGLADPLRMYEDDHFMDFAQFASHYPQQTVPPPSPQILEAESIFSTSQADGSVVADFVASQSILSIGEKAPMPGGEPFQAAGDETQNDDDASEASNDRNVSSISLVPPVYTPQPIDIPDISLISMTRQKLQELGKYVLGHTYRKVMVSWNIIDARFQKSHQTKTEMVRDGAALATPQKHAALPLSTLVTILCSNQVRVVHNELVALGAQLGFSAEDVDRARKIAAIRICLGPEQGKGLNPRSVEILLLELKALADDHPDGQEKLVSVWALKNCVFPQDAAEREAVIRQMEEERSLWIRQQVEEKKRRDELKDRVEARRRKLMLDYGESLRSIQFPKGPLKSEKLNALKELIQYCKKCFEVANLTQDITVADESVSLLGLEAFPSMVQESRKTPGDAIKGKKKIEVASPGSSSENGLQQPAPTRIGYEGQFRIRLQGDPPTGKAKQSGPSVLFLIKETVSYGKGLNGLAYRDVVEMLQSYASTRLGARFRCHSRWWRYKVARSMWKKIFVGIQRRFLISWAKYVRHVEDTRNFCWRKVKAWRFYTRRAILRREHFRVNFWPFYVWHRWAAAQRTATEKARFLVGRVMPAYVLMRHYRAWKRYFVKEKADRTAADNYVLKRKWRRARVCFRWYRRWTRRRIRLRHNWYTGGAHTHREKIRLCKMTPLLIWKAYWFYKKQVQLRVKSQSFQFRSALLPFKRPKKPLTAGERRQLLRAASAESGGGEEKGEGADDVAEGADDDEEQSDKKKKGKKSKGKGSKGGKGGKNSGDADEDGAVPLEQEEAPQKAKKIFHWVMTKLMDPTRGYDIPSDGEDDVRCSIVNKCYSEAIAPLLLGPELEFLENADDFIRNKVAVMSTKFLVVDKLALIESGMRYHRFLYRAFMNLRIFARVSRNYRRHVKKVNHHRKQRCFLALLTWMLRDPNGGLNLADQTDAEQIYFSAKSYRMDKMMKWRDASITIKQVYGRDYDDVDISVPVPGAITTNKKRNKAADKAKAELKLPDGTPYVPPNFLEWDREDRATETEQAERMVIVSRDLVKKVQVITATAQVESEMYNAAETSLNRTVDEVLETEDNITQAAVEAEMLYISQFKRHAADLMLTTLCKISREVDILLMRRQLKKYFRSLRMPMLDKRGTALFNYKKISNWIRICKRLMSISHSAPKYHRWRTLWVVYNRWLKLVEKESLEATPGLVKEVSRRKELLPKFSKVLVAAGFKKMPYVSNKRLYAAISTKRAIFFRWVQETQEVKLFALMEDRAGQLAKWRLIQKCFFALRTSMRVEDTYTMRCTNKPFVLVRAESDLDQLRKRFIAVRKRSLALAIASMNRRTVHYQIRDARRQPCMKKFLLGFRSEVDRRLVREQRILLDAFEARGTHEFVDVQYPDQRDPIMPALMQRIEAPRFVDPHPAVTDEDLARMADEEEESEDHWDIDRQPPLPCGYKVCKIRVNHSIDMGQPGGLQGIVGWQIVWAADGSHDVEGPKRGRWKGASMKMHELTVPKDDFVLGIEYLYDGFTILGLRAKLHFGGFSRWLGDKPSMSTLSVYLSAELAPRQEFEDDYKSPGRDEDEAPAMPRSFVIGLSGLEMQGRVSSLALVVRKVKSQHIFSYYWVNDALLSAEKASEMVAGTSTMLDLNSMPAQLNVDGPDFDPRLIEGESVTNASRYGQNKDAPADVKLPRIDHAMNSDDVSVGDMSAMSSISHASKMPQPDSPTQHASPPKGQGSPSELHPQVRELTSSEEQFFDVFRMRLMEITTAQLRAESLARKLWTARQIRDNPALVKLTSLTVIAPLTRWFFSGICKRVVKALPTEAQGEQLIEEAKQNLREADRLWRRSINESNIARDFEGTPQVWRGKSVLPPAERAQKKLFMEQLKALKARAAGTKQRSIGLSAEADQKTKIGRQMLPRMCLSVYICSMFALKIAASRHKELLMQTMDLDAIREALRGGGGKLAELSDVGMDMIRFSLANKKPNYSDPLALDKLVEAEVKRMRERVQSGQQTPLDEMSMVSSTASASASSSRIHNIPGSSSGARPQQPERPRSAGKTAKTEAEQVSGLRAGSNRGVGMSNSASLPALTLPPTFLPILGAVGNRRGRGGNESVGSFDAAKTSRKRTGLNAPQQFSSVPSLFKLTKSVGLNERKAAGLKGSSSMTALNTANREKL